MSNSYSQNGEDLIILNELSRRGIGTGSGKLLDIGAWDPVVLSNSRLLIELGWKAVLIEPSPGPLRNLIGKYKDLKDVTVIGAAVGIEPGLVRMQITDDAVSTSDAGVQQTWKDAGGYIGSAYIPVITIQQIFDQFGGPFDFVNIDTEGSSVALAIEYLKTEAYPRVMCVEHDGRVIELMEYAQTRHYAAIHTTRENVILARLKG